eukprot:scaffold333367_cov23-Prasinocladus_malaysianus.AAC.1
MLQRYSTVDTCSTYSYPIRISSSQHDGYNGQKRFVRLGDRDGANSRACRAKSDRINSAKNGSG